VKKSLLEIGASAVWVATKRSSKMALQIVEIHLPLIIRRADGMVAVVDPCILLLLSSPLIAPRNDKVRSRIVYFASSNTLATNAANFPMQPVGDNSCPGTVALFVCGGVIVRVIAPRENRAGTAKRTIITRVSVRIARPVRLQDRLILPPEGQALVEFP
jgi:hypothetical protein